MREHYLAPMGLCDGSIFLVFQVSSERWVMEMGLFGFLLVNRIPPFWLSFSNIKFVTPALSAIR